MMSHKDYINISHKYYDGWNDHPYGKFTHDFTYEIFICEIVMWNWNNSYMKISYVKSISHVKVSHMKFSYVKSLCGIGTIHI